MLLAGDRVNQRPPLADLEGGGQGLLADDIQIARPERLRLRWSPNFGQVVKIGFCS